MSQMMLERDLTVAVVLIELVVDRTVLNVGDYLRLLTLLVLQLLGILLLGAGVVQWRGDDEYRAVVSAEGRT
jgi:hypothetical protein